MEYIKKYKCKCKTCTEGVLIKTPYNKEYVHRSDGWWHTQCLKENQGRKIIHWDALFKSTEECVNTIRDKEDLTLFICRQYSVDRSLLEYTYGRKLVEIYKGNFTFGDKVTPRDIINILSENMNALNKMNTKNLYGINRVNWDLSVVFSNFWNKYKSSKEKQCDFEIKDNSEYKIQYRKIDNSVVQKDNDDVLGDLDDEEFF